MDRVFNFSAGPSVLPEPVLARVRSELCDYRGTGMSVMEMSHRSPVFHGIIESAEQKLRQLMRIPDDYEVLFLQGGASTQFAMVPMNLLRPGYVGAYVETGIWAKKAAAEARKLGNVEIVAGSGDRNYSYIPQIPDLDAGEKVDYLHITTNNTIYGTCYRDLPETPGVPLVADMSSNILGQAYDVSRFGLIYAGAQKNVGPAGLTLVIARRALLERAPENLPAMLHYPTHARSGSCYNTPPCFAVYVAGLVFEWLLEGGGVAAMEARNREKSGILYDYLDRSRLFRATVQGGHRSLMNVPFLLRDEGLTRIFLAEAEAHGLVNLKGHRSVGGLRASLYNAMPMEGVRKLVALMERFERQHL